MRSALGIIWSLNRGLSNERIDGPGEFMPAGWDGIKARFLFSVQVDRGLPVACRLQAGRFINLLYFSVIGKNNLK